MVILLGPQSFWGPLFHPEVIMISKTEYKQELEELKSFGVSEEEYKAMLEFYNIKLKKTKILMIGRKRNVSLLS